MTVLIAIDPSTTCTGLAVFEGDTLRQTIAVHPRKGAPKDPAEAAREIVWASVNALADASRPPSALAEVVIEWPEVYRDSSVDANDLFVVAAVGLGIATRCTSAKLRKYKPKEWTGQIPKTTDGKLRKRDLFTNARAKRVIARLSEAELRVFHQIETYDELDAVGIGLHAIGRGIAQRHRVYPGAT